MDASHAIDGERDCCKNEQYCARYAKDILRATALDHKNSQKLCNNSEKFICIFSVFIEIFFYECKYLSNANRNEL